MRRGAIVSIVVDDDARRTCARSGGLVLQVGDGDQTTFGTVILGQIGPTFSKARARDDREIDHLHRRRVRICKAENLVIMCFKRW